jgi:hypothetical protein
VVGEGAAAQPDHVPFPAGRLAGAVALALRARRPLGIADPPRRVVALQLGVGRVVGVPVGHAVVVELGTQPGARHVVAVTAGVRHRRTPFLLRQGCRAYPRRGR